MNPIDEAKRKLPLPELMKQVGLGEHAKKSSRCPFHDDQRASFSIYRDKKGEWRWKCHAGCGSGDEINFLELHGNPSRRDATKRFLELAGVNGADSVRPTAVVRPRTTRFNWDSCVKAFTEKHVERLAKWRGYSDKFCRSLRDRGLVGIYNGCIAFPVHAADGSGIGAHYRSKSGNRWFYTEGCTARPLVIGASTGACHVYLFESYWDAFALIDKLEDEPGLVIIYTRCGEWSSGNRPDPTWNYSRFCFQAERC